MTMRPSPELAHAGQNGARSRPMCPPRFTSTCFHHSSGSCSRNGFMVMRAAFATSTSIGPSSSCTCSTMAATASQSAMSQGARDAPCPSQRRRRQTFVVDAGVHGHPCPVVRPARTAAALPIPWAAPVTSATTPSSVAHLRPPPRRAARRPARRRSRPRRRGRATVSATSSRRGAGGRAGSCVRCALRLTASSSLCGRAHGDAVDPHAVLGDLHRRSPW